MQWPVGGVVQLLLLRSAQNDEAKVFFKETVWFLISPDSLLRLTKILLSQIPDYNVAIAEEMLFYETNLWLRPAPQTVP